MDAESALEDARAFVDRADRALAESPHSREAFQVAYAQLNEVIGLLDAAGWRWSDATALMISEEKRRATSDAEGLGRVTELHERVSDALQRHRDWKRVFASSNEQTTELAAASKARADALDALAALTYALRDTAGRLMKS